MSKIHFILLASIASATALHADEMIRQTQLGTGLVWDQHLFKSSGQSWSPLAIGTGGSRFSLYADEAKSSAQLHKLDTKTVGSSFPNIDITIRSADPYVPVRTRADQPFIVEIKRQGADHKTITLRHSTQAYDPTTHVPSPTDPRSTTWQTLKKSSSAKGTFYPSIQAADPTQAEGEESFTTYAAADRDGQLHPLGTTSIQIWPVAKAAISGVIGGSTTGSPESLNKIAVNCQDLYPDSITYVQIYRGKPRLGTLGKILPQTVIRFDSEVPQDQKIPLGDFANTLADGTYTLEVLHITPFNQRKPERLTHISFVIDRGMHAPGLVRAQHQ